MEGKKIYFASDFHLGVPDMESSRVREKKICQWLDEIKLDAAEIYLVGDILDYWFEYRQAVPRGFTRLFGKLADLTDAGIPVHWFAGNHDMWVFEYLPEETGIQYHRKPLIREYGGKRFYIAHGDGLGPGDSRYKMLKKVLGNRVCQWLFARFHPNFGLWLMRKSSHTSRNASYNNKEYLGEEKEWLILHSKSVLEQEHFDYFVYGHRHLVLEVPLNDRSTYFNLGDWITQFHYGVFDGKEMVLKKFEG